MPVMQSPPGPETKIDGRRYLYFAGTAYLGLQGHPEVIRAACQATLRYGIGSATSRAWFGNVPPTLDVERLAARFFAAEDAFYYVSGYVGNHILVTVLADAFDAVFLDEFSHYSVLEAAQLSARPVFPFRYRDPEDLAAILAANLKPSQRPLVISDGVFPVLGTIAPVTEYCHILANYPGALLAIDDAHGVGVLGRDGWGTFQHAGLADAGVNSGPEAASRPEPVAQATPEAPPQEAQHPQPDTPAGPGTPAGPPGAPVLLFSGTLSKALGGFGGIIPGTQRFIQRLKSQSHYYDGASCPPVPAAAATARALQLVMTEPSRRRGLWDNAGRLKSGLRRLGLPTDDTPVPIVCLKLGSAQNMRRIQGELMQRGIVIAYAAAYSGLGPEGALRLAVFSTHTKAMIAQLLDNLQELL